MTGPTHVSFGFFSAVLLCTIIGINIAEPYYLFALIIGSLAPDIDTEGESSITGLGRMLRPFLGWKLSKLLDAIMKFISSLISMVVGHRGAFHWPIFPIIGIYLSLVADNGFWFWFAFGYLSHLLADMMTISGIYALSPFYNKKISIAPIKTSTSGELVFFLFSTLLAISLGYGLMPESLQSGLGVIWAKVFG